MPENKLRRFNMRSTWKNVNELYHIYMKLGMFNCGRKEILEQGLGDGICFIALHIIKQEFEQLRRLELLNLPLNEWNTTRKVNLFNLRGIYEEMSESAPNIVQT